MPKPITRRTAVGPVTEYFDDPAKHGFEAEQDRPAEPPAEPIDPDDLASSGE